MSEKEIIATLCTDLDEAFEGTAGSDEKIENAARILVSRGYLKITYCDECYWGRPIDVGGHYPWVQCRLNPKEVQEPDGFCPYNIDKETMTEFGDPWEDYKEPRRRANK